METEIKRVGYLPKALQQKIALNQALARRISKKFLARKRHDNIKFVSTVRINSPIDVFFNLFSDYRTKRATYKNNGNLHCELRRARSLIDFGFVCMQYFPKSSKEDIIEIGLGLKEFSDLNFSFCPDVRRYVCGGGGITRNTFRDIPNPLRTLINKVIKENK